MNLLYAYRLALATETAAVEDMAAAGASPVCNEGHWKMGIGADIRGTNRWTLENGTDITEY